MDAGFIRRQVAQALALRKTLIPERETNALRLVHGELDGLPGLIVDRYADWLVVQCLTAGADAWKSEILAALIELTGIRQVYERSDVDVRKLEGLAERAGLLSGTADPERVVIEENGLKFGVDVRTGQKTGFYLDQRCNRQRLGQMAAGRQVLNCFCYTGAFSAYALAGGAADVLSIDSSADALLAGQENIRLNWPAGREGDLAGRGCVPAAAQAARPGPRL